MKTENLVKIKAKSECMDIEVVMTSKKATPYLRKLNKIQKEWIKSVSIEVEKRYRPRNSWMWKTRKVRIVPEGIDKRIIVSIEPVGKILN